MKKFSKYLVYPFMLLFFVACTDLDEKLQGDVTEDISVPGFVVENDGPQATGPSGPLSGAYAELRNAGTANHGSYYAIQTITSDEQCIATKGGDWFDGGILLELHRQTYTPTHGFINNAWNGSYNAINTCNELLANSSLDPQQIAEARALRAYFYMRLLDLFGNVKLIVSPGVDVPQSTRDVVFDFVESEFLATLGVSEITPTVDLSNSDLGTDSGNPFHLNQYSVMGLIAKLYLNAEVYRGRAMYDKAEIAADYVIQNGGYMLCDAGCDVKNLGKRQIPDGQPQDPDRLEGYAAVFAPNNDLNPEHIFVVFYDEAAAGGMNFSQMNLHYSSQFTWNLDQQPWNGYATLEEFYNMYDDADKRKAASFTVGEQLDFTGGTVLDYAADDDSPILNYTPSINELWPNSRREAGARASKFSFQQLGRQEMNNDYPILRLGEMYLIRGEAKARAAGDWNLAVADANIIRARAGMPAYSSLDADEFLAERGREMFQEGQRRTDLIRFGNYNDAWWEKQASMPFVNIFPIPNDQVIAANGTLTQNPGY